MTLAHLTCPRDRNAIIRDSSTATVITKNTKMTRMLLTRTRRCKDMMLKMHLWSDAEVTDLNPSADAHFEALTPNGPKR